jgi:hypothetical protein
MKANRANVPQWLQCVSEMALAGAWTPLYHALLNRRIHVVNASLGKYYVPCKGRSINLNGVKI